MLQQVADISVFSLTGEFDCFEARQLLDRIITLMRYRWSKIVLDFSEVAHIDYRVWRDLSALAVATVAQEGGIKLANMTPYHQKILQAAGADRLFETYDSVGAAVMSFHVDDPAPAGAC